MEMKTKLLLYYNELQSFYPSPRRLILIYQFKIQS
jgi:hypothetical protein